MPPFCPHYTINLQIFQAFRAQITPQGVYIIRNLLRYIINAKHCISSIRRRDTRWRVMRTVAHLIISELEATDLILSATPRMPPCHAPFATRFGPRGSDAHLGRHSTPRVQVLLCGFLPKAKRVRDAYPFCFCLWATKKIFSAFLRMNSNSYQKILSFQI